MANLAKKKTCVIPTLGMAESRILSNIARFPDVEMAERLIKKLPQEIRDLGRALALGNPSDLDVQNTKRFWEFRQFFGEMQNNPEDPATEKKTKDLLDRDQQIRRAREKAAAEKSSAAPTQAKVALRPRQQSSVHRPRLTASV